MTQPPADGASPPRLLIHAGLGKSGSSAIQLFLARNAAHLADQGVVYLGRHLELPTALPPGYASDEALNEALARAGDDRAGAADAIAARLRERMAAAPDARCFIWSNINLLWAAPTIGLVAERLLGFADVAVVLYFRHQAAWLRSAYAQWGVKHKTTPGPVPTFAEFARVAANTVDYRALLRAWTGAIGRNRLHARSLDRIESSVADLLALAGLPPPEQPARAYPTPDPAMLSLFKLRHGQHDDPALPGPLEALIMRHGLDARRYREVDPDLGLPTGAAWQALVDTFARDNEVLARKFGVEFDPPRAIPDRPAPVAAPAHLVPPLLDLILALDERVRDLERRLAEREAP